MKMKPQDLSSSLLSLCFSRDCLGMPKVGHRGCWDGDLGILGIGKSQLEAENPSLVQIPEAPVVQMLHPRSGSRFVLLGMVLLQLWLRTPPWKREGKGMKGRSK